jgi:ketosteroid isomerase-like protein
VGSFRFERVSSTESFDEIVEKNRQAGLSILNGSPDGYKEIYSERDDVTNANPFGPPVRGREAVFKRLDGAAANYRDGESYEAEEISRYVGADLGWVVEIERARAKVAGGDELVPIAIRTTSIFRHEEDGWRLVHRHADPIVSTRPGESVIAE